MPKSITLALGYLTVPLVIKSSIHTLSSENNAPSWTFASTVSINCFVHSPPTIYPTREKHLVQLRDDANKFEQETLVALSHAMSSDSSKSHGLMTITDNLLGILSPTAHHSTFVLQVVQFDPKSKMEPKSYHNAVEKIPSLDLSAKPTAIMELCQSWPHSKDKLAKTGAYIYRLACLYGYWDNWRVFEGICQTHQINVDQLLNIHRS
ncbi:hypothetical protein BD560DRAFT_31481 [Blakeslea trispora]|nr:hypothetical protein BD560DRAFT_31481 [Blakeslea trispora]